MKKIMFFMVSVSLMLTMLVSSGVYAATQLTEEACENVTDAQLKAELGCSDGGRTIVQPANFLINAVIAIFGIVAVITLIMAGQNYITSNGEAEKIRKAKTMLLYGVVGLVVTALAFAIVNFVIASAG